MRNRLPFFFLLIGMAAQGQALLENNPASIKWYQANTPHFRVLFPKGFEQQGVRLANTLEHIHEPEARSLGTEPRKISVILQNRSSVSNAFVSVLPRRSEFYTMPPQDYNFIGTIDWLNLLASHEYRHVVQYQHAMRGFNKFLYYLFGSTTFAGMAQAAAPMWFWEGDAVATETAFTHSGRGRIPNFGLVFRTNLLEGREFNYHKQYLRSYKHNIPDHYVLGYHMISYLRQRTGDPQIWGKITAHSWNVPFVPFAFSNAIKKETGLYVTGLYRAMARDLRQSWQKQLDTLELTSFDRIKVRRGRAYTDYLYPQPLEDGSILVMKKGIGDIEKFVLLKDGKEKRLYIPGFVNDAGMLSVANSRLVWNEYGYHPRWLVKNYSLVKSFDLRKKKKRVIGSKHERYGSATLSPDGTKVVTIRSGVDYKIRIVVLEVESGKVLKEFPNPENHFYAMPRWTPDGNSIVLLKTLPEGKTISLLNYATGAFQDIIPVSQENVGHPVIAGSYVLFNSPVSGIDNIYAYNPATHERFQVTCSKYGAYNPAVSPDGKKIYYNDQTRDGLDVVSIPFDPTSWKSCKQQSQQGALFNTLTDQEHTADLFETVPQQSLEVKKYSKLKGLINPYTWGFNVETDLSQAGVGVTSRDLLSTTSISAGYFLDINERTGAWKGQVSYQGLYPIFDLSASYAKRHVNEGAVTYYKKVGSDTVAYSQDLIFDWQEQNVEGGIRIPFLITSSRFQGFAIVGNTVGYTKVTRFTNSIDGYGRLLENGILNPSFYRDYIDDGTLLYNHFSFSAYRLMKQSRRDINSKWGQRIYLDSYSTPFQGDFSGNLFTFYGLLYFPGLFKHHSLWGHWGYQHTQIAFARLSTREGLDNYIFRNRLPLPRGLQVDRFQDFYSMSANYTFPVWYPDVAVGPLLNIQRLRANAFFDYGFGQSVTFSSSETYASVGAEAKLDINILRFLPQFDIGVRFSYGLQPSYRTGAKVEVLIGTFNF